jgi:hypothetical protein
MQVIRTPSLVVSHWHIPMVKLQVHTTMPFIMQQQLHIPPANIVHRFCIMLAAILSSHEQVIFIPPLVFSIFIVHRGTIIQLATGGIPVAAPIAGVPMVGMPMPCIPIPVRSIIMLDIKFFPFGAEWIPYAPWRERDPSRPDLQASLGAPL